MQIKLKLKDVSPLPITIMVLPVEFCMEKKNNRAKIPQGNDFSAGNSVNQAG